MSELELTVFLPVRNGMPYIKECIDSVLKQNSSKMELVILDNHSTDETISIIKSYSDKRITLVTSDKPLTIEESWGRILAYKNKKQYMTVIGHDDLLEPNFVDTNAELVKTAPKAQLYFSHFKLIDRNGQLIRTCFQMPALESSVDFIKARLMRKRDSFGTGYVMRSLDYEKVNGIPLQNALLYSDDILWLNLLNSRGSIAISPEYSFKYRLHNASTSGTPCKRKLISGFILYSATLHKLAQISPEINALLDSKLFRNYKIRIYLSYFGALFKIDKLKRWLKPLG